MIPEGWKELTLSSISTKIGDGIHATPKYDENGLFYFINGNNINEGNLTFSAFTKKVGQSEFEKYKLPLSHRTILMSINGTIGNLARYQGEAVVLGKSAAYINIREDFCESFAFHVLSAESTQNHFMSELTGSTIKNLSLKTIRNAPLIAPPLPEQRRIAEILSTWDRTIETVEALIANARAQKKAMMQSLLTGKQRLPGFLGEWKSVDLKSMGKTSSGGTPDSNNDDYWNGDILWTTPTDITALNRKYITDTKRKISAKGLANCSAKLLPAGTLLICTRATIGDVAIATSPISTNQGFKNLTPNASFVSEFLFHLFGFQKHIFIRYACGSTFLELSKFDFEKREFLVPERAEQQAIANILDDADNEIESFEAEAQTLRHEKSALMQQLLTGKRRLNVSEKEAAHA